MRNCSGSLHRLETLLSQPQPRNCTFLGKAGQLKFKRGPLARLWTSMNSTKIAIFTLHSLHISHISYRPVELHRDSLSIQSALWQCRELCPRKRLRLGLVSHLQGRSSRKKFSEKHINGCLVVADVIIDQLLRLVGEKVPGVLWQLLSD